MRDTHREAGTQAKGEAGSLQEPNAGLDPGPRGHNLSWRQPPRAEGSRPATEQNLMIIAVKEWKALFEEGSGPQL